MTYNLSILVTYSYNHLISSFATHNSCSNVLIILHGSIRGFTQFYFAKISGNTTIKDSKLIVISWCKCDKAITS
jgi:hypothetical protein